MNYHKRKLRKEDKKQYNYCSKQYVQWEDLCCEQMDIDEDGNVLSVALGFMNHYYMAMEYYERHVKG